MATKKTTAKTKAEPNISELQKLADAPSPAEERIAEGGDWVKSNNPSPAEQKAESERTAAIAKLALLEGEK